MADSIFKSSMGVSFATFLSRILGLIREIFFAHYLGSGIIMSAWTTALMIPNLFRRLLGEGALGTALVPMIMHTIEKEGHEKARKDFSTIMIWLTFLLALITVIVSVFALIAYHFTSLERWKLVWLTTPVIMPYCILICLIGIVTSLLNSFKVFFLPTVASLSLNVFLILSLAFVCGYFTAEPLNLLHILSITVLASGVAELIFLGYLLKRQNMFPKVSAEILKNIPVLKDIFKLALPGMLGAGAFELGSIVDKTLSMQISNNATAAINYSDRLAYLPIGVFAVAFGTVSLPYLSKLAVQEKMKTLLIMLFRSLRQLLFITIPIGLFLFVFGREALAVLFRRGAFDENSLSETFLALRYLALGIPAFAAVKVCLNGFYARKNMITPMLVTLCCLALNVCLSLCFMRFLKQGGLTLATSISSYANTVILLLILHSKFGRMPLWETFKFFVLTIGLSILCIYPARYLYELIERWDDILWIPSWFPPETLPLMCAGIFYLLCFFAVASLLRMHEAKNVIHKLLNKILRRH